jgi:hypothetical protein
VAVIGLLLGDSVGEDVGDLDGVAVGDEGMKLGKSEGDSKESAWLEDLVGKIVGAVVGIELGDSEGNADGIELSLLGNTDVVNIGIWDDDIVDETTLESKELDETGSIVGATDGWSLGVAVLVEKPVGFKHRPECWLGCWHCR